MVKIRCEDSNDATGVRDINLRAFDGPAEADLIKQLRDGCPSVISLVAEDEGRLVGHIFFSPVVIDNGDDQTDGMGLGPMAVLPESQRKGIGSKLIEAGLDAVRDSGHPFVVVLGHPDYYPRFGFTPASRQGITCEITVPDEMFMILPLDKDWLSSASGVAKYRIEFDVWK